MMPNYWIAVASRNHVQRGIEGGFAQVCHGKCGPLQKMSPGDQLVYYSPTEVFGEKTPCRRFTAIGVVSEKDPYLFQMSEDFIPWRRDVTFLPSEEVPIEPLLDHLSFIPDKRRWGFPFRRGCFTVPEKDFYLIRVAMGV